MKEYSFRVAYSDGYSTTYTQWAATQGSALKSAVTTATRHEREAGLHKQRWIASVTDVTFLEYLRITAEQAAENARFARA